MTGVRVEERAELAGRGMVDLGHELLDAERDGEHRHQQPLALAGRPLSHSALR
jgi:hypothetical protein